MAKDCYVFDDIVNVCDAFDVEIEENYDEEKEEEESTTPIEILEVNDDDSVENDGSVPSCVIAAGSINHQPVDTALLALMDSGSSVTLIHRSKLPRGVNPAKLGKRFSAQTTAGNFEVGYGVTLRDVLVEPSQCSCDFCVCGLDLGEFHGGGFRGRLRIRMC